MRQAEPTVGQAETEQLKGHLESPFLGQEMWDADGTKFSPGTSAAPSSAHVSVGVAAPAGMP